jgi:electron transfer flavoprotein alpha subunit
VHGHNRDAWHGETLAHLHANEKRGDIITVVTFVIIEHRATEINRASLEAITAAQALGPVVAVVPGVHVDSVVAALGAFELAELVSLAHPLLDEYTADGYVGAIAAFVRQEAHSHVAIAHTYQARDYAPRLAARLGRALVSDCVRLTRTDSSVIFTRPIFQGKLQADVVVEGPAPHLFTCQVGAFSAEAARRASVPPTVRKVDAVLDTTDIRQRPEPRFREAQQAVDLSEAERIVSVGRGIKEEAHIALARDLAAALGAELAASRPICDAGWLPMDRQVGSSGQTVSPKLYVALGISGAIQHIVGMKGAKTIVAINKDADAPIFEVATHGIVGDLFEIVPAMIAALKDARPGAS